MSRVMKILSNRKVTKVLKAFDNFMLAYKKASTVVFFLQFQSKLSKIEQTIIIKIQVSMGRFLGTAILSNIMSVR